MDELAKMWFKAVCMLDICVQHLKKLSEMQCTLYSYRLLTQTDDLRFHKIFDNSPFVCILGNVGAFGWMP